MYGSVNCLSKKRENQKVQQRQKRGEWWRNLLLIGWLLSNSKRICGCTVLRPALPLCRSSGALRRRGCCSTDMASLRDLKRRESPGHPIVTNQNKKFFFTDEQFLQVLEKARYRAAGCSPLKNLVPYRYLVCDMLMNGCQASFVQVPRFA